MTAIESAAGAILDSRKASMFPVIGRINTLQIRRSNITGAVVELRDLSVRIDGQVYSAVTYSGAFLAEIIATESFTYLERQVVIEKIGTQMNVAYTINTGS